MPALAIQLGLQKYRYPHLNNLKDLRHLLCRDIQELPDHFDLMYIDDSTGHWTIIHNQQEFEDKIYQKV